MKTIRLVLWAIVLLFAGIASWLYILEANKPHTTNISQSNIGGPFELVRDDGSQITRDDILGRNHALFFGFTHCPEICPTTLFEAAGWLKELGADADKLDFYFFTVDPERDTPEILNPYVNAFDARITGVTGTPEKMTQALGAYRVFAQRVELEDDDYTMDHSASVLLFRKDGSFMATISYGEDTQTAIAKLKRLLEDS